MKLYLQAIGGDAIMVMRRADQEGAIGDIADTVTPGKRFLGIPYDVFRAFLDRGVIEVDASRTPHGN